MKLGSLKEKFEGSKSIVISPKKILNVYIDFQKYYVFTDSFTVK